MSELNKQGEESMKIAYKLSLGNIIALFVLSYSACSFGYTHTVLRPIKWQGEKWEYLVEHPSINHVDPSFFEEILDTAGQEGWELIEVTGTNHFYAFYFKRPLLPHKIDSHRARLARNKQKRANKEATERNTILTTVEKTEAEKAAKEKAKTENAPPTNGQAQPPQQSLFSKIKSKLNQ